MQGRIHSQIRPQIVYPGWEGMGQRRIPQTGLLTYFGRPNSDEYLVGEDTEIGEDTYIWGFLLPATTEIRAATGWVSGVSNGFYDTSGSPVVILASEIAALSSINSANVLFKMTNELQQVGKLAVYTVNTPSEILIEAKKVLRIS